MEKNDFFRIEFLNTISFIKTIENYFKKYNQTCPKNLNNFVQLVISTQMKQYIYIYIYIYIEREREREREREND